MATWDTSHCHTNMATKQPCLLHRRIHRLGFANLSKTVNSLAFMDMLAPRTHQACISIVSDTQYTLNTAEC